ELARAPTTGHATLPPPPPVTRTAFHTGVVTPPQQPTLPAPVTSVPGQGGLPLPAQYLQNGTVDQGVDYAAPGGTPLFAMGPGPNGSGQAMLHYVNSVVGHNTGR